MMPDALRWLGVKRIDWLCSMSNEKYEAIVGAGIKVMQHFHLNYFSDCIDFCYKFSLENAVFWYVSKRSRDPLLNAFNFKFNFTLLLHRSCSASRSPKSTSRKT